MSRAKEFISVHHNASIAGNAQGSLAIYCDFDSTVTGTLPDTITGQPYARIPRNNTSTLARKIVLNLTDSTYGLGYPKMGNWLDLNNGLTVLNQTYMPSTLTEASFVSWQDDPDEAWRFYHDSAGHVGKEVGSIIRGWLSFRDSAGIALIDYAYEGLGPSDPTVVKVNFHTWNVPYEGNWIAFENVDHIARNFSLSINTPEKQQATIYNYYFHHWERINWTTGETILEFVPHAPGVEIGVDRDPDGYHYYVAYFEGGPFDVTFTQPPSTLTQLLNNQNYDIRWLAPAGARQSCSLRVELSTNNGSTWAPLTGTLRYNYPNTFGNSGRFTWSIPSNLNAPQCKLRIVAWDRAGNDTIQATQTFAVANCFLPVATFTSNKTSGLNPLTVNFTDQSTWQPTSYFWDFGDGTTSNQQNPSHVFVNPGIYTVRHTSSNACGTSSVTTMQINVNCTIDAEFTTIGPSTGFDSIRVTFNEISSPPTGGVSWLWDFGDGTTSTTPDIVSHDYRTFGSYTVSLTQTFPCGTSVETKPNFVVLKCCQGIRGNINDDPSEGITVADLTYLINFLFNGGPSPWCWEESNVNGTSSDNPNISDVTYLVAFLFTAGSSPPVVCR